MTLSFRTAVGGRIDRNQPLNFQFQWPNSQNAGDLAIITVGLYSQNTLDGLRLNDPLNGDYIPVEPIRFSSTGGFLHNIYYLPNITNSGNNVVNFSLPYEIPNIDIRYAEFSGITYSSVQGTPNRGGLITSQSLVCHPTAIPPRGNYPPLYKITSGLCRIDETGKNLNFLVYAAAISGSGISRVLAGQSGTLLTLLDISSNGNIHAFSNVIGNVLVSGDFVNNGPPYGDWIDQLCVFNCSGVTIPPPSL